MTVQIAAASTALILGPGRRRNGRWQYGQLNSQGLGNSELKEREALRQCGLILDTLGPGALREVRDGKASLNAVYERAVEKREQERALGVAIRQGQANGIVGQHGGDKKQSTTVGTCSDNAVTAPSDLAPRHELHGRGGEPDSGIYGMTDGVTDETTSDAKKPSREGQRRNTVRK